uniref:Uncharacterized protein n=1 Tax=Anguilla anguilla TaxID=7936 RepID=A0A0E9R163_ANGAN
MHSYASSKMLSTLLPICSITHKPRVGN